MTTRRRLQFLAIGSELLLGQVLESNSHWLQKQLRRRNCRFEQTLVIGDQLEQIVQSIRQCWSQTDILVICGGLGPTDDDLTRQAVGKAFASPLLYDAHAHEDIKDFFKKINRPITHSNIRQAYRPACCTLIRNPVGTAPGLWMETDKRILFSAPGVPSEFKLMVENKLFEKLPESQDSERMLRVKGIGESLLMDQILENNLMPSHWNWGTVASLDGINVHVDSLGFSAEDEVHYGKLSKHLAPYTFAVDERSIMEILLAKLAERNWQLSLAESCTGGGMGAALTAIPGASGAFLGGICAYQNELKTRLLGVPAELIATFGAVSAEVAVAMAKGALEHCGGDIALSCTGIAGPDGGSKEKPVGTVFIGVATKEGYADAHRHQLRGGREEIRNKTAIEACFHALDLLDG